MMFRSLRMEMNGVDKRDQRKHVIIFDVFYYLYPEKNIQFLFFFLSKINSPSSIVVYYLHNNLHHQLFLHILY